MRVALLAAVLLIIPSTLLAQDSEDRSIVIINRTSENVAAVYATNRDVEDWGADLIGNTVIPPGRRHTVNVEDHSGYCRFDLKAVMEDGQEMVKRNVNACRVTTWTIYE